MMDINDSLQKKEDELADMTPRHRRNLKRWLRRNSPTLKLQADLDLLSYPLPTAEMAEYYAAQEQDIFWMTGDIYWMTHTDLYRRLIYLCWFDRQNGEVV